MGAGVQVLVALGVAALLIGAALLLARRAGAAGERERQAGTTAEMRARQLEAAADAPHGKAAVVDRLRERGL